PPASIRAWPDPFRRLPPPPRRWRAARLSGMPCCYAHHALARDANASLAFTGLANVVPGWSGVRKAGRLQGGEPAVKETDLPSRRQPPTVRLRRLAGELRDLRRAAGLTREDAAEQTNINSATLYRLETAKARPQKRTLLALLDKYGVTDPDQRTVLIEL